MTNSLQLKMRINQLSFNPLQPTVLLLASEDNNLYTFDIRHLSDATQVYKSHVGAVLACDWSPTGREFVSGAYDRTLRLWSTGHGQVKEIFHTKRMQRVTATQITLDARFLISGSDDGSIRIWKSKPSERLGAMDPRQRRQVDYGQALQRRWSHVGDVPKLQRQHYLPKPIYQAQKLQREVESAERRKDHRRRQHAPKARPLPKPKGERKQLLDQV